MILQEVFAPVDEIKPLSKEQMDEMDKARESDDYVTPELQKPAPGFFDGMGEGAWKGIASSALKSASALDTVMSSTGMVRAALNNAQVETGYTFDDLDLRQSEIENRLDQDSKELRRRAREDYGPDPTTMGTAAQIIYGVAETIPKAIGYSVLAGPAGGSVLFGADLGISRAQELMDEGVDKNTAINAGLVTFAAGSLGMRLPATFGRSRIASATIGAVANMGLTAAELQGVNWVLQNQNYNELAEKYQLNVIDMATSGIFGGVFGGVMWRPSATATVAQNAAARRAPLRDRIYNALRRASPENISDDAIRVQADLHAAGIQVMADRAQIDADSIAPEIVAGEASGFSQRIPAFKPEQDLVSGIKDYFGTTWDARESGYMMQDGEMLNMSGVHEVNDERIKRDLRGRRVVDHRDVSGTNIRGVSTEQFFENQNIQNQSDYMYNFMARTGAMRMDYASSIAALTRQPTRAQLQMMQRMAYENDGLIVSYYTPDGRIVDEAEWEGPVTQKKLREFFKQAQEKADSGVSGAFAQRAWHGSPHVFESFSTEHIGTGEGAQAHGWGLYFAANRKIADEYRNHLSVNAKDITIGEQKYRKLQNESIVDSNGNEPSDIEYTAAYYLANRGSKSEAIKSIEKDLNNPEEYGDDYYRSVLEEAKELLENNESDVSNSQGRVFEVDIPDESEMLDENLLWGAGHNFELKQKIKDMIRDWNITNPDNPIYKYPDNPTGKDIYKAVAEVVGGPKAASLWFNERGIKGITYDGLRDGRCYVVFDDKAIQTIEYFQRQMQEGAGAARGSFDPARNRITLTPNANISTYSHEMGHWYLENLFQLSRRAVSESTLKEDADILLKEFGVKSLDDWDALGIEGQRKYQEQFASWVEIYLSEGRAPKPALQRLFERLGQWLVDLYRELGGVKKAVGDTYKAETGSELPPVSEEVGKVLDRLFDQDRKVRKASQVSKAQVAAARMVQANRTNNNKLEEILAMPSGKNKTRALRDLEKSTQAQLKAIQAAKRGLPVDVSQEVEQMNVDVDRLVEMKGNFGRAYVMGNTDSAVVLQNRDRSDVGSIGQMNAIAANPQYGLVSVSRSYSGAPVVSYGQVPDNAHLGNNDFIVESNGNRVPFMYAVVEAGDVETSNFIDGSTNAGYGNPQRMNTVVGNGRMTALKEAYQRGTANQYRTDLESDTAHGIKPEVIREMKNPVLVRVINPEDVNTGFISRSNGQQVLALDDVEVAREDAPKIRARAGQYEFDEAGNPTNDTLALFIQDLHDPNALGRLITSDGRPTPEAVRRIRNAVFFEAYQSPELSALFSQEVDPGIRRILNGLANVAPRIIELREQAQELDFSNLLVEAANRIRQARLNPDEGVDFASQMSFLDNPATSAFVEFLDDNANSAAAIARTLNPLIDWAQNAAQAADGGLFGGDAEVHVDLADVVGQLRNIINEQRAGAGLEPLPEIDVAAIRDQIQAAVNTATDAVDEVGARLEAETQQAEVEMANKAQALDAQRQQSLAVLDEKTSVNARAQFLMDQNPDQVYRVLNENGMEVEGTLSDLLAQADEEIRQAEVEASGIGRAVECVLRNGGI